MLRKLLAPALVATALLTASTAAFASTQHGDHGGELAQAKRATASYRKLATAKAAGYGLLVDAAGIACIDMPDMGAMGVHYVNGALVGDAVLDPLTPEALVYAPGEHGRSRLVALEYIVFQSAWDAEHSAPPELFGQTFDLTAAGNRFGLPAFYSLHAWVWKHNPAGTFSMWNPNVTCHSGHNHDHTGN
jgi:hypothetical protein